MDLVRVPGARDIWRVALLRWLVLVAVSLPAMVICRATLANGPARMPYLTGIQGVPSLTQMSMLFAASSGAFVVVLIFGIIAVLLNLLMTGGILAWFSHPQEASGWGTLVKSLWRNGLRNFSRMLGIALRAAILSALGAVLIFLLFRSISNYGSRGGWDAFRLLLILPGLQVTLIVLWFSLVGTWAFWLRYVTVADDRRIYRRTAWITARIWRRFPLRAPVPYLALSLFTVFCPATALLLWLSFETATLALQMISWLAVLLVYSLAWTALVVYVRNLYQNRRLDDLRRTPDAPWHSFRRLQAGFRKSRRQHAH